MLAGVCHHQHPPLARLASGARENAGGPQVGERLGAFGLAGVHADLVTIQQGVEHLTDTLTEALTTGSRRGTQRHSGAHGQADRRVRRIAEPMYHVEGHDFFGPSPARCQVEYAAAADGGELVSVTEERDPGPGLVGDGEQGAGGVLVEHPRLVDEQEVVRSQHGCWGWGRGQPSPAAGVVPSPSVLVGEPGCGERARSGLTTGDRGRP